MRAGQEMTSLQLKALPTRVLLPLPKSQSLPSNSGREARTWE